MRKVLIFPLSFCLFACAHDAPGPSRAKEGIAQEGFERSDYTAVQFDEGRSELSAANKQFLANLKRRASETGREIEEIKILAWADQEYPGTRSVRLRTREVILANERASSVREILQRDLRAPIDVFNMARRPGFIARVTEGEEYLVKRDVAMSGVTATELPTGETSYTKAGKVLVIIDYKEDKR